MTDEEKQPTVEEIRAAMLRKIKSMMSSSNHSAVMEAIVRLTVAYRNLGGKDE